MNRPHCITCKKPLQKHTHTIIFTDPDNPIDLNGVVRAKVYSKEEAQRYTNQEVISVKRGVKGTVFSAGVWDRTSYGHDGRSLFCCVKCGESFGISMAERMIRDGRISNR